MKNKLLSILAMAILTMSLFSTVMAATEDNPFIPFSIESAQNNPDMPDMQLWGYDQKEAYVLERRQQASSPLFSLFSFFGFVKPPVEFSLMSCQGKGDYNAAVNNAYYCERVGNIDYIKYGAKFNGVSKSQYQNADCPDCKCWMPPVDWDYSAQQCGQGKQAIDCLSTGTVCYHDRGQYCVDGKSTCQKQGSGCDTTKPWAGTPYISSTTSGTISKIMDKKVCPPSETAETVVNCAANGWVGGYKNSRPANCPSDSGKCSDGEVMYYHYGAVCVKKDNSCTHGETKNFRCEGTTGNLVVSDFCSGGVWTEKRWATCDASKYYSCDSTYAGKSATKGQCQYNPPCTDGQKKGGTCDGNSLSYEVCKNNQFVPQKDGCAYGCENNVCKSAPPVVEPPVPTGNCETPAPKCGPNNVVITYNPGKLGADNKCSTPTVKSQVQCTQGNVCSNGACVASSTTTVTGPQTACNIQESLPSINYQFDATTKAFVPKIATSIAPATSFAIYGKPDKQQYRPGEAVTISGVRQTTKTAVRNPGMLVTITGPYVYDVNGKRVPLNGKTATKGQYVVPLNKQLFPEGCGGDVPVTIAQSLLFDDEGLDKYDAVEYDVSFQLAKRKTLGKIANPCTETCGIWSTCESPPICSNGKKEVVLYSADARTGTCNKNFVTCDDLVERGIAAASLTAGRSPTWVAPGVTAAFVIKDDMCNVAKSCSGTNAQSIMSLTEITGAAVKDDQSGLVASGIFGVPTWEPVATTADTLTLRISNLEPSSITPLPTEVSTDKACGTFNSCPGNYCQHVYNGKSVEMHYTGTGTCRSGFCAYLQGEDCSAKGQVCNSALGTCALATNNQICTDADGNAVATSSKYICYASHYDGLTKKWVCDQKPVTSVTNCAYSSGNINSENGNPKAAAVREPAPGEACGDGAISTGEQCDGTNLNGKTCISQGFEGGTLKCNAKGTTNQCQFNTASCYKCGDGKISGSEECDYTSSNYIVGSKSVSKSNPQCTGIDSTKYESGTFVCENDCTIDLTSCVEKTEPLDTSYCGDNVRQSTNSKGGREDCDGTDLRDRDCTNQKDADGNYYTGGTLACTSDCKWDTNDCDPAVVDKDCSDGTENGQCKTTDGSDPQKCVDGDLNYDGDCCPTGQSLSGTTCVDPVECTADGCFFNPGDTTGQIFDCVDGTRDPVGVCPSTTLCKTDGCRCLDDSECTGNQTVCGTSYKQLCSAGTCIYPDYMPSTCTECTTDAQCALKTFECGTETVGAVCSEEGNCVPETECSCTTASQCPSLENCDMVCVAGVCEEPSTCGQPPTCIEPPCGTGCDRSGLSQVCADTGVTPPEYKWFDNVCSATDAGAVQVEDKYCGECTGANCCPAGQTPFAGQCVDKNIVTYGIILIGIIIVVFLLLPQQGGAKLFG